MAKFVSGAMAWVGLLAACAGETNMTDAAALERQIHDLEKEVRRLSAQMKTEKYGLRWVDCPEAFEAESENKIPILAEVPEKAISHKDGKPTHILIEGDNYHALTCLNFTHRGKIDVIYIDPPYNTGSDGFTYKDKRYLEKYPDGTSVPKDHPLRHSYWLSFMSKRLRLAKDLLSDRGVIFISIDDNEMANLKLLCDQVFQEKNFVADVIWHSKYTTSNDANGISRQHEHVLVYAKSIGKMKFGLLERTAEMDAAYKNPDNDPNGPWKATPLHAKSGTASSLYTLTFPNGRTWSAPKGRYPRYSKESLMRIYESGGLYFRKSGGIDRKTYLSEVKGGKTPGSIWSFDEVGSTHQANEELAEILGKGVFDNPKPVEYLLFKYAAGTGWDCPRAHVLVMFREIRTPTFKTQTLGRILRNPEPDFDLANFPDLRLGYVYTNYSRNTVEARPNGDDNPVLTRHANLVDRLAQEIREDEAGYVVDANMTSEFVSRADYGDLGKASAFQGSFVASMDNWFGLTKHDVMGKRTEKVASKGVDTAPSLTNGMIAGAKWRSDVPEGESGGGVDVNAEVSANDAEKDFTRACLQLLSEQTETDAKVSNIARSAGVFRGSLRLWLQLALPDVAAESGRYKIFLKDLAKEANSKFRPAVTAALKDYAPIRKKFL